MNISEKIKVRNCRDTDFRSICELLKQLWPQKTIQEDKIRKIFKSGIKSSNTHYLCATTKGEIIAFCTIHTRKNLWQEGFIAHIDEFIVHQDYRRHKVGRHLIKKAERFAKTQNAYLIELNSAFHRTAAHSFYEHCGFTATAKLYSKNIDNI